MEKTGKIPGWHAVKELIARVIVLLMGVSGSGKTTIGTLLAEALEWEFHDADHLHSVANRNKMHHGIALSDRDRLPWLRRVRHLVDNCIIRDVNAVIACSALRQSYRDFIRADRQQVRIVYLKGSPALIARRVANRVGHFMPATLVESQFQTLEEPGDAATIGVQGSPRQVVRAIRRELGI